MATVLREYDKPVEGVQRWPVPIEPGPLDKYCVQVVSKGATEMPLSIEIAYTSKAKKTDTYILDIELTDHTREVQGPYRMPHKRKGLMRIPLALRHTPKSITFLATPGNSEESSETRITAVSMLYEVQDDWGYTGGVGKRLGSMFQKSLSSIANILFLDNNFYSKFGGLEGLDNTYFDDSRGIEAYARSFLSAFPPDVTFYCTSGRADKTKDKIKTLKAHSFILWPHGVHIPKESAIATIEHNTETGCYEIHMKYINMIVMKWVLWYLYTKDVSVFSKVFFNYDVDTMAYTDTKLANKMTNLNTKIEYSKAVGEGKNPLTYAFSETLSMYLFAQEFGFNSLRDICVDILLMKLIYSKSKNNDNAERNEFVRLILQWFDLLSPELYVKLVAVCSYLSSTLDPYIKNTEVDIHSIVSAEKDVSSHDINVEMQKNIDNNESESIITKISELATLRDSLQKGMNDKQKELFNKIDDILSPKTITTYSKKTKEYIHFFNISRRSLFNNLVNLLQSDDVLKYISDNQHNESITTTRINNNNNNNNTLINSVKVGSIVKLRDEVKKPLLIGENIDQFSFPCKVSALKLMINNKGIPQLFAEVTTHIIKTDENEHMDTSYLIKTPNPELHLGTFCTVPYADIETLIDTGSNWNERL